MLIRKIAAAAAATIAVLGLAASSASAFQNAPVGSTVTATSTLSFSLGAFSTCTSNSMSGPVAVDNGANGGGSFDITAATFSGCSILGAPFTMTSLNLPWTFTVNGSGAAATLAGFKFRMAFGSTTCEYTGSVTGTFNNASSVYAISGSVTKTVGGFPCPNSTTVSGSWLFRNGSGANLKL